MTYELLALAWWQNPWSWVLVALVVLMLVLGSLAGWFFWFRRTVPRMLKKLHKLPLATRADQLLFCNRLTSLMRRLVTDSVQLTDRELIECMKQRSEPAEYALLDEFERATSEIKFGGALVAPERLPRYLTWCEGYYARLVYQRKRARATNGKG